MFGVKVPVPLTKENKKGAPRINFEVLPSGGFAVQLNIGKLRGRVSWSAKRGFSISGGARSLKKKQKKEEE